MAETPSPLSEIDSGTAKYVIEDFLGSSAFSRVYRARTVCRAGVPSVMVILRHVEKSNCPNIETVRRHFSLISQITHPFLAAAIDSFELPDAIILVTDYFSGATLHDFLMTRPPLSYDAARALFRKILDVVEFLHDSGYSHRNISDRSVLVAENGDIRLIGLSFLTPVQLPGIIAKSEYTAFDPPEVLMNKEAVGILADCWALGVLLHTLVTRSYPWRSGTPEELCRAMAGGAVPRPPAMSGSCHALLLQFLEIAPLRRIAPLMAKQKPWLAAPIQRATHASPSVPQFCKTGFAIKRQRIAGHLSFL
jgi:serine/threonine-protein kinase